MNTLISLLFIALSFYTSNAALSSQFETGIEGSIHWDRKPYHVLQSSTSVPRSVDVPVEFRQKFVKIPQVAISPYMLDWLAGAPNGFLIHIISVTESVNEAFVIRYTAPSSKNLYGIFLYYIAIFDPRIHVQWFETTNLGKLATGEGARDQSFEIAIEGHTFDSAPIVAVFHSGVKFSKKNWCLFSKVTSITTKSITLQLKTWAQTNIEAARFCLFMGTSEAIWASDDVAFKIPNGQHFWRVFKTNSDRPVDSSVDVPKSFSTGERGILLGFTGYDTEETRNQRIYLKNFELGVNSAKLQMGTWDDSVAYQLQYKLVIYLQGADVQVEDEKCAELFSECEFKGEQITVCNKIDSLAKEGWTHKIKSFKLPPKRLIKLFSQEVLRGQVVTYSESQKCLEEINFSFAQVLDKN